MKYGLGALKLTEKDYESLFSVMRSNWLSPGEKVSQFESEFAFAHSQKFGVMTNSGTDALRIGLLALKEKFGWKDGDWVIVPSVTFPATVNVVLQAGLRPVLADVKMTDYTLNPENVERRYGFSVHAEKVRAMIPVHLAGKPCDMDALMKLSRKYGWKVLEDSCECVGVEGICQGDITAFSFYVAHILTTGVGGMATTNDVDLKYLMWSYANHGRRYVKGFEFDRIGYSARPTEFEAALGLNQLPKLSKIIEKRRENAFYLTRHLEKFPDLICNFFNDSACMFLPVLIRESSKVSKRTLMAHLTLCAVENRELMPLTNQPCYADLWGDEQPSVAKWINEKGFYIGCHQDLSREDLDAMIEAFRSFFNGGFCEEEKEARSAVSEELLQAGVCGEGSGESGSPFRKRAVQATHLPAEGLA